MQNKISACFLMFGLLISGASFAGYDEGVVAYKNGDFVTAFKEMTLAATQGDADAQYNLGILYGRGEGVSQDYVQAALWYYKAAEQGKVDAQYLLSLMYLKGEGVTKDFSLAVLWCRKAAEQGFSPAQNLMGVMYEEDVGVSQDYTQAAKWYRQAAEQSNIYAEKNLGNLYETGRGVPQSTVVAYAIYNLASVLHPWNTNGATNTKMCADLAFGGYINNREIKVAQALSRELAKPGNFSRALDKYILHPAIKNRPYGAARAPSR